MDEFTNHLHQVGLILKRGDAMSGVEPQTESIYDLVARDRQLAIRLICQLLGSGNGMYRKVAAFALGQLGDPSALPALERQRADETARGNIEAIDASILTLRTSPLSSGSSEQDRWQMVDNIYHHRPLNWKPDLSSTAPSISADSAKTDDRRCFIVTAACGCPNAPEVVVLSAFRDDILVRTPWGRYVTAWYYRVSPPVAAWLAASPVLSRLMRAFVIAPLAAVVERVHRVSPD